MIFPRVSQHTHTRIQLHLCDALWIFYVDQITVQQLYENWSRPRLKSISHIWNENNFQMNVNEPFLMKWQQYGELLIIGISRKVTSMATSLKSLIFIKQRVPTCWNRHNDTQSKAVPTLHRDLFHKLLTAGKFSAQIHRNFNFQWVQRVMSYFS